ncbi:DeoR/GlpR family DNA-binding transcription regulator [Microlunatus elymi]|nr:DeoR/GlpR family DNA-binding transcription regulator [Microlunatus elymi]
MEKASATGRGPARERHQQLADWLRADGRVEVVQAAARLGVAPETVRRDLRAMEQHGRLVRVHGGAVPVQPAPATQLSGRPGPRYTGFGRRLWQQLPRQGTLLIGTGAPALGLAEAIAADPPESDGLTVVTNFLDAAIVLSRSRSPRSANLRVYNIGGTVSPHSGGQEGDWAISELNRLRTDISVVCAAGVSSTDGLTDHSPAGAAVSRAETLVGRRVIAIADASAAGKSAFVQFASIDEIDELAFAGEVDDQQLRPFRERGLPLMVAPEDD